MSKDIKDKKDRELIAQFLEGNKKSFDELMLRHKTWVYYQCYDSLDEHKEDANDAVQQVFLRLYKYVKGFRGDALFTTYLYRIVVNVCIDIHNKNMKDKRYQAFSLNEPIETEAGEMLRDDQVAGPASTPRDVSSYEELKKVALKALRSMDQMHKQVIILRHRRRLTYEEIAEILEIDMGTLKSRLNRARAMLREKVKDWK